MKKIIMALSLCVFSFAAFAGISKTKNLSLPTQKQNEKIEIAKAKISEVFNNYEIQELVVEQGYILISFWFVSSCPQNPTSDYKVAMVITVKIWDDGRLEVHPWFEKSHLFCS